MDIDLLAQDIIQENCLKKCLRHENQGMIRQQKDSSNSLQVQMKVSYPVYVGIRTIPEDKSRYSVTVVKGAM